MKNASPGSALTVLTLHFSRALPGALLALAQQKVKWKGKKNDGAGAVQSKLLLLLKVTQFERDVRQQWCDDGWGGWGPGLAVGRRTLTF